MLTNILAHRRIWAEELEKLDTQRLALQRVCDESLDKFEATCHNKQIRTLISELKKKSDLSLEDRRFLQKKLFETLTFPIQYFEISKSTVMDGYEDLVEKALDLEHEIRKDTQSLSVFHQSDLSVVDPWTFDGENGTVQPFHEFPCADASFAISKFNELEQMCSKHKEQLQALKEEFKYYAEDDHDGWNEETHFRFEKLRNEYRTITDKKLYQNRLEVEFPKLTKSDIKFHVEWIERNAGYKTRLNAINKNYQKQVAEFIKSTIHQFPIVSEQYLAKVQAEHDQQSVLQRIEETHKKLSEWRRKRMQDIEREEEIRQFEMQQAEAQNEEKEAKRLQELEAKRNAVAEFKMQKRQKQLEMIEAYEQAHRDELAMLAELKPHNVERVKYRSNERGKKLEQKRHEIEERELQRQEIERKLEQLRLSVAITAETDWNRILRPTKSFQVSKETEKLPQLFTVPGFSVASLMKDRRFRISAALHQLGLQNSAYAHDLIMKINKLK